MINVKRNIIIIFLIFFCITNNNYLIPNISLSGRSFQFFTDLELYSSDKFLLIQNENLRFPNCKLCSFKVRNTMEDSTKRDIVLTSAFKKAKNLIPFLKTLRTTGSKAQCVFILDNEALKKVSIKTRKIIKNCGGQIINVGNNRYKKKFHVFSTRFIYYYMFIEYNLGHQDRIIINDLYDTVFQGDPFNKLFPEDSLYLVNEGKTFNSSNARPNIIWLKSLNYKLKKRDINEKILCSGFIGGTEVILHKLIGMFLEKIKPYKRVIDQGIFNFFHLTGEFEKNHIKLVGERQNELVRHLAGEKPIKLELGYVDAMNNKTLFATVIHHYYKWENKLESSILKYCPKDFPNLENYVRSK